MQYAAIRVGITIIQAIPELERYELNIKLRKVYITPMCLNCSSCKISFRGVWNVRGDQLTEANHENRQCVTTGYTLLGHTGLIQGPISWLCLLPNSALAITVLRLLSKRRVSALAV